MSARKINPGVGYGLYSGSDGFSIEVLPPVLPSTSSYAHPFKITKVSITETESSSTLNFKCFVGHVFGLNKVEGGNPWTVDEDQVSVSIDSTITEVVPGIFNPGVLDERNVGTYYSGELDALHDTVIYVRVKPSVLVYGAWEASLVMKPKEDAIADLNASPIRNEFGEETVDAAFTPHASLSPAPPLVMDVTVSGAQDTYTFQLTQTFTRFKITSKYVGEVHIPVAYIRMIDDVWTIRQILRSDIFFPYTPTINMKYIDGYVDNFTGTGTCA